MNDTQLPLRGFFASSPLIPAIRKEEYLDRALAAHGKIIYLLVGDPDNCERMIHKILAADKLPFVNLDLLNGFSRDKYAVNYLQRCGARGIISTHPDPLRHAHANGMYAIQRTFLLDSGAMETMANHLKNTAADAVEVLPAVVAPRVMALVRSIDPAISVVAGGLISSLKDVEDLLMQGIGSVSISDPRMWIS